MSNMMTFMLLLSLFTANNLVRANDFDSAIFSFTFKFMAVKEMPVYVRNRTANVRFDEQMIPSARKGLSMVKAYARYMDNFITRRTQDRETKAIAKRMDDPALAQTQITDFLNLLDIDISEFEPSDPKAYRTFNEFFFRKLKPNARPVASPSEAVLVAAADCRLNVFETINNATEIWIKGKNFNLTTMLHDEALANKFVNGSLALFRLAPQDYHRFHSPVDGVVKKMVDIPGTYFSVNPLSVCTPLDVFTENRRAVSVIESEKFGVVAFVSVGATLVGSINFTGLKEGAKVKRGQELGYFAYGGSTVAVVFQQDKVLFDKDLVKSSLKALETYVQVGEKIGMAQ